MQRVFRIQPWVLLAGLAVLAGAAAFWGTQHYLQASTAAVRARWEKRYELRTVLVAARDLAAGHRLEIRDFARREMPAGFLPSQALPADAASSADGRRLLASLRAGDPVLRSNVEVEAAPALAERLTSGTRAVTVPVDEVSSQAGLVRPGDRVDLMLAEEHEAANGRCVIVRSLLESLHVLATGRATREAGNVRPGSPGGPASYDESYSTITLDVTPQQAQQLAVGLRMGELIPMLRGAADSSPTGLASLANGRPGCVATAGQPAMPAPVATRVAIDVVTGGQHPLATTRFWVADSLQREAP
jgi:pilus assembly protein CpaB